MTLQVSRVEVWATSIEDRPGGAAEKLRPLAEARANLEFTIARRTPEKGGGVLFVTPILGEAARLAAQQAGFTVAEGLHSLRIDSRDEPGLGARLTQALAEAGINLRGISGAAIGDRAVYYLAFDTEEEAARAEKVLADLA